MSDAAFSPDLAETPGKVAWLLPVEGDGYAPLAPVAEPEPDLGLELDPADQPLGPARRGRVRRLILAIHSATEWVFGSLALGLGLALLAATPVAQFLSFGYLLEAEGRVARSGRLRDGFVGVRRAARVGSMVLGAWLWLLPVRLVASLATSAELIDPGGPGARRWRYGLIALTVLTVAHITIACARGGRLRDFLWPPADPIWLARRLRRGRLYGDARDAVWDFVAALRLPAYFRLGLLGFLGTLGWLVVPVTVMALGRRLPILSLLGGILLAIVALGLPFLQAHYAAEGRFAALFEYRVVRSRFRRAPWAFALTLWLTAASSLPLYLLKIEMIPRETIWLPSLVFLAFIVPARVLTGWAYRRSSRRETPRHWLFRGTGRLVMLPTVAVYALFVFLSQYTAWNGLGSLYEQHAFLIPVPFLGR
jgi:hypothetical protein